MQQHHHSESTFDQLADIYTRGEWSIAKWISNIFIDANAMLLMVFLRKNIGRKIVSFSSWFFGASWLGIVFFIATVNYNSLAQTQEVEHFHFSGGIIWTHSMLFALFCVWRAFGAWRSLRRSGRPGVDTRHIYAIGESVIYPVIWFIFKPLRLIDDELKPRTFWKLNEDRWMQFWEPLIIIITGYLLGQAGYSAYGNFLILAATCLWYFTFQAYNNTAKIREAEDNARTMSGMIEPEQSRDPEHPHLIK